MLGSSMLALRPAVYNTAVTRRLMLNEDIGSQIVLGFADTRSEGPIGQNTLVISPKLQEDIGYRK